MNFEFHYYVIHWLARKAGLAAEEAYAVAYSSQYVDASIVAVTARAGGRDYEIACTQNYGFWNPETVEEIYLPFHFIPGGEGPSTRADGKSNPWSVRPDSALAKEILVAALGTRDPYRVGIALHSYADSWAHQNFSGRVEEWNRLEAGSVIPPVGHAQALKNPDGLETEWRDPRLAEARVVNRDRYAQAARKIYKYLATYSRKGFEDVDWVVDRLLELWGGGKKQRNERIYDLIIDEPMPEYARLAWLNEVGIREEGQENEELFSGYSKLLWLKSELLYKSEIIRKAPIPVDGERFFASRIYKWSEAAKAHRAFAKQAIAAALKGK